MKNLADYQQEAHTTAIYPKDEALGYLILGLTSEAGEVAGKFKKCIRDKNGEWWQDRHSIAEELGDILWYVSELALILGFDLESIARENLMKLTDRAERGTLGGNGDTR